MSLASYSDLETAVALWLARVGDSNITANAPDFITLCEARMAYGSDDPQSPFPSLPLRIRAMETSAVIPVNAATAANTVGGTANAITFTPVTAITAYALGQCWSFPATYSNTGAVTVEISGVTPARNVLKGSALSALAANDIVIGGTYQLYDDGTELVLMPGRCVCPLPSNYLAVRTGAYYDGNPINPLEYISPEQATIGFNQQWPSQSNFFSIEGDAIWFVPAPDAAYNFVFPYYQKFGALSSATNWVMTNAPNVYLYGTLLEASIFMADWDNARTYHGLFLSACNGLQSQNSRDRHSGSTLTIRNDTGSP